MLYSAFWAKFIVPHSIYQPTIPKLPIMDISIIAEIFPYVVTAIAAALFGWMSALQIKNKFGEKINLLNVILPTIVSVALSIRFGFGMELVQGFVFCLLLLFASNSNIRTREVADSIPIMVAIAALIGIESTNLPMMLLAAVLITLPQLAIAIIKPNTYGGADIKLMAASAFLLGVGKGLFAIITGLLLAIICTLVIQKIQKKSVKKSFALIPYLAIGSMIALFL